MKTRGKLLFGVIVVAVLISVFPGICPAADDVVLITKEELRPLLGSQDIVIIDLRLPYQWEQSNRRIPGAVRENPYERESSWADNYPKDRRLVLYCA